MWEVQLEYIKSYVSIDVWMFQCWKREGRVKGPTGIFSWQNIPFMFITCHLHAHHMPSTCLCTFIYMCMYVHTVNIFHVLKHKCIPTFEIAFCLTRASPLSPWLFHHSSLNSNATPPDRPILTIMVVYSKHVPYFIPLSTSAFCNEALQLLSLTSEVCILLPWIQAGM